MKFLHISDLHGKIEWYDWLAAQAHKYDAVVVAGDLIDMTVDDAAVRTQIARVTAWVESFSGKLFLCSGNHDVILDEGELPEQHAGWLRQLKFPHVTLDRQSIEVGGLRIACVPWNVVTADALSADIVVCHAPPEGAPTAIARENGMDWGDFELAESLRTQRPAPWLLLGGHVHRPRNWVSRIRVPAGLCWSLNPGCRFERAVPNHIVIDTTRQIATHLAGSRETAVKISRSGEEHAR